MRAFIAIDLPKEIKDNLCLVQENFKKLPARINWVNPDNIHLTLRFLGEIEQSQTDKIITAIKGSALLTSPFQINLSSISVFPDTALPRVIWIGINSGNERIQEIYRNLGTKLKSLGIPEESRQFLPHITIARIKTILKKKEFLMELNNLKDTSPKVNSYFQARKITLFKSRLTAKGAVYEIIKELDLLGH